MTDRLSMTSAESSDYLDRLFEKGDNERRGLCPECLEPMVETKCSVPDCNGFCGEAEEDKHDIR